MSVPATNVLSDVLSEWMKTMFESTFTDVKYDFSQITVVPTGDSQFGEFQCNNAMAMAKDLKKSPRQIAQSVVEGIDLHESVEKVEVAGPGFINIYLKTKWMSSALTEMAGRDDLCVPRIGHGHTVVIDYSSPNVAKPMHIGHIRSTIIGNSIDRMHRFLGYKVISDNHIGDWGTQFGIIIMGYRHLLDKVALESSPIEELERIYVASYEKGKADEEWMDKCRAELVKLQAGDVENMQLWRQFVELSLGEFERIYKRLGVSFDHVRGESYYRDRLGDVVAELKERGLATESEGAIVVFLDDEKLPACIVRKSDGGYNYATSDLATVESRVAAYSPEKIIYVTDERQQLHFRQIFAICRKMGVRVELHHVWFGLMRLPDATFSTREGNVIKLEKLLDEAERRSLAIVKESSPNMPEEQQKAVARSVGIGAVKYADLSQNPQSLVTFTWDKALALDGNSGPYLQYAYARIASVQDKYAERFPNSNIKKYPIELIEPVERDLAVKLLQFPETVLRATLSYKPSSVAEYLYDLAKTYSTFYQNVPFLKAEPGVRESRVRLCSVVAKVLRKGLELLGIETPDRI
ncbi:MAG: arginine--tRNA ligase [Lentisphaerae bacterium]|nr:arginine--tRNA ligase [Lentisphaerota bacterium]